MNEAIQVKISDSEFTENHEKQLHSVVEHIYEVVPEPSTVTGSITKNSNFYEGRLQIRSKIGSYVAKAKARNLFVLMAQLQSRLMRQVINWKERKQNKKKYLHRRQYLLFTSQLEPDREII